MNKKHVIDRNFVGQVSSSNLLSHSDPSYRSLIAAFTPCWKEDFPVRLPSPE